MVVKVQLQVIGLSIHKWVTIIVVKDFNFNHIYTCICLIPNLAYLSRNSMFHTINSSIKHDITNLCDSLHSQDVVYSVATAIKRKQLHTSIVDVIGIEDFVDALNVTFSELDFLVSIKCIP